jgi:hypothetical protein
VKSWGLKNSEGKIEEVQWMIGRLGIIVGRVIGKFGIAAVPTDQREFR